MAKADFGKGDWFGISAYLMWGCLPLFWKTLSAIGAIEILCFRIVSAAFFMGLLVVLRKRLSLLLTALRNPKCLAGALICAILVSANWYLYIVAISAGRTVEASFGYYATPLLSMALGIVVLKERIDLWAALSLAISALGVILNGIAIGEIPWLSLGLAVTFAAYGLAKKLTALPADLSLAFETAAAFPFAALALGIAGFHGELAFPQAGASTLVLLILAGPITALPLFAFAEAASSIPLTRLGFYQYISPSLQLLLAVFAFGEAFGHERYLSFALIAGALALYLATRGLANANTAYKKRLESHYK